LLVAPCPWLGLAPAAVRRGEPVCLENVPEDSPNNRGALTSGGRLGRISLLRVTLPSGTMESPDSQRYYELKILEQVEGAPDLPRRVAASKLGVSVKLAHKLLTGLVERGLLHVKKENARRWRYFLTPQGITEKARLTREFIEFSFEFYREARRRSAQACRDLAEAGVKRIAFLGLGELAEIAYLGVQEWNLDLVEVFDRQRAGKAFFGCLVRPIEEIASSRVERILVTSFNPKNPMSPGFLPEQVEADLRMVWVFGGAAERSSPASPGPGDGEGREGAAASEPTPEGVRRS